MCMLLCTLIIRLIPPDFLQRHRRHYSTELYSPMTKRNIMLPCFLNRTPLNAWSSVYSCGRACLFSLPWFNLHLQSWRIHKLTMLKQQQHPSILFLVERFSASKGHFFESWVGISDGGSLAERDSPCVCICTHTQTRIQSSLLDSVWLLISSCGPLLTPPSLMLSLLSPPLSLWQLCLCSCHLQFQLLFITSPLTPADTHTRTHSVSSMCCHGSWDIYGRLDCGRIGFLREYLRRFIFICSLHPHSTLRFQSYLSYMLFTHYTTFALSLSFSLTHTLPFNRASVVWRSLPLLPSPLALFHFDFLSLSHILTVFSPHLHLSPCTVSYSERPWTCQ